MMLIHVADTIGQLACFCLFFWYAIKVDGRRQAEKGMGKETPEQLGRRVKKSKVSVSGRIELD